MHIQDTMTIVGHGKGKGYTLLVNRRYETAHAFIAQTRADLLEYLIIHLEAPKGASNIKLAEAVHKLSGDGDGYWTLNK